MKLIDHDRKQIEKVLDAKRSEGETMAKIILHRVRYCEHHWNGTSGEKEFATKRKAMAYAAKLQTAWCNMGSTGKIVVENSAGLTVADYSIR